MESDRGQGWEKRGSTRMQKPLEAGPPPHLCKSRQGNIGLHGGSRRFLPTRLQDPGLEQLSVGGYNPLVSYDINLDGHSQQLIKNEARIE